MCIVNACKWNLRRWHLSSKWCDSSHNVCVIVKTPKTIYFTPNRFTSQPKNMYLNSDHDPDQNVKFQASAIFIFLSSNNECNHMISQVTCVAHPNLIKIQAALNNKPTAIYTSSYELMLNKPLCCQISVFVLDGNLWPRSSKLLRHPSSDLQKHDPSLLIGTLKTKNDSHRRPTTNANSKEPGGLTHIKTSLSFCRNRPAT